MPTRHLPPTTPLPAEDMAGETRPLTEAEPPVIEALPPPRSFKLHYQFNKFDGKLLASGSFIQDSLHYDPVLSFKMGKQEVLRKWSSSLNAYLELVFRDNKLMKMPDVSIFKSLLVFDVSYNEIPSLNGVSKVSSTLEELHVSKNEMTKMEELDHLYNLHILKLGSNRLRVMENLHNLTNLQELWLGRNHYENS
ncbi:hypothetical protein IFM89_007876 [Coptis chinensis]|uniref:Uncharacterized protein n=1 Tax=Coptis chinensis TaxID=261450 RepID=A0A835HCZ9_9MAGN|nr:hypothetical protein IFM89_007876 [Coptis chinensis]